jgi:branched-subunit amino acid aminotransferase/4-amino-4-deoxychorismate lyase
VHEPTLVAPVNLSDLPRLRAAFATNAAVGVRPIAGIDEVRFPADHSIVEVLRAEYARIRPERL